VEVPEVCLQALRVLRPCQSITPWRGGLLQAEEACPQDIEAEVMEKRCEWLRVIPGYGSSYAGQHT
jgi:hypothetical protein